MTDVRDLTRELVSIPSHETERAAGDFIERWIREETAADVTRDDAPDGGNVIARRGPGGAGSGPGDAGPATEATSLALVGHHDVVPPDETQIDDDGEYVVEERDGRLYGRGSADMKGSVAAMLCAFRAADPDCELVLASFVGEERGGVGCRHAIDRGFAPEYAVVAEGSTNYSAAGVTDVVVAHKGRRASTLVASGEAAHASEPDAGVNAVYRACDAVDLLRDLEAPRTTVLGHDLAGSVAVTGIDGGSAWNVVPERCEITVDERTVPEERADLGRVADLDGLEWSVDQDLPPMQCTDDAFAESVLAAARAAQAGDPELVVKPHATDAGWLASRAGTHCIVAGAAEPGEAHTADESVGLDVLDRCYRTYLGAVEER